MKKIILILLYYTISAFPSLVIAANAPSVFIKTEGGVQSLMNSSDKFSPLGINLANFKYKHRAAPFVGLGIGANVTENLRVDLTFNYFFNHKINVKEKDLIEGNTEKYKFISKEMYAVMINGAFDVFDASVAKFFIGGGIGMSNLRVTPPKDFDTEVKNLFKSTKEFAYALTAGVNTKLMSNASFDLSYSWKNLGTYKSEPHILGLQVKMPFRGHHVVAGIRYDM